MEPLTIEELKTEKCPRISAEDMIELSELRGHSHSRSPTKANKLAKPKLLIIDVRSQEEYPLEMKCVHVPCFAFAFINSIGRIIFRKYLKILSKCSCSSLLDCI